MNIPRYEHPNPQFERENWLCLNGEWQFEKDRSVSGTQRKLYENAKKLDSKITVPFCPESRLSGVEDRDFLNCVWYKKEIELSGDQLENDVLLHFGAVDYFATVYINEKKAGTHRGGYVGFTFDITKFLSEGKNVITVCAEDDVRSPLVPRGKQSEEYYSHGCDYTRTTGIWQSVWLEFVPKTRIESIKIFPDVDNTSVGIEFKLKGEAPLKAVAL